MSKDEMKVLIVDDMEINREVLATMVEGEYQILEAENGAEALEILQHHRKEIALIFLDALMPIMGGFELLEEMNKRGWIKYIPVIMVSSDESNEFVEKAFSLGVVDFMPRLSASIVAQKRISNTIKYALQQRKLLQKEQEKSEEIRLKDTLTGAYSIAGFREAIISELNKKKDEEYILWYGDIKNFKFINSQYGTTEGDNVLKYIIEETKQMMSENGIVCRISADRIAGFCTRVQGFDVEKATQRRLLIKNYLQQNYPTVMPDIYIGVYVAEKEDIDKLDIDTMISKAQMAQQTIKNNPEGGQAFYDKKQWENKAREIDICGHIDSAIENGEISIWIQPQIDYSTNKIVGGEALCRWNHEKLGFISPGEFIPVLEEAKLITKLDYYVWEQACACMQKWKNQGIIVPISVNVSRVDIAVADVPGMLVGLIEKYGLTVDMLRVEITENVYMDNAQHMMDVVRELQKAGFIVEMDDFGSGFSSLNMLRNVPLDVLKLDLGFLRGEEEQKVSIKSGNIINAIVRMAYGMDMPIIAEGVETEQQADFLRGLGCNLMQGYLFSKPLQVADFEKVIENGDIGSLPSTLNGQNMSAVQELFDANSSSSFIFNHCIGAAALVEYSEDKLELVIQNEEFTRLLGIASSDFEKVQMNIFDSMITKDKNTLKKAVEEAISLGFGSCELLSPYTKKWITYDFRHVSDGVNSSVLSCMVKDATNEFNLRHEVSSVIQQNQNHPSIFKEKSESLKKHLESNNVKGIKITNLSMLMFMLNNIVFVCMFIIVWALKYDVVEGTGHIDNYINHIFVLLIILLILSAILRIANIKLVINPLRSMVDCLENETKLYTFGSYEFRKIATTYNHLFETNMANKELLQYASEHDNLTGVLNRRAYDALTKIYRLQRTKIGLVITDADKFKDINDNYGHDVGDKILKKIAYLLQSCFRSNDKIVRYGGDEFVVFLSDMTKENGFIVEKKIQEINRQLSNPDDGLPAISISAGVAFSEEGYKDELFKNADTKLYEAKTSGRRNCRLEA